MARPRTSSSDPEAEQQQAEAPAAETQAAGPEEAVQVPEGAFTKEQLIANSVPLTGHEPQVLAGAFYGNDEPYMTADEAKSLADKWLGSEDTTGQEEE